MEKRGVVIVLVLLLISSFLVSCKPRGPGTEPLETAAALRIVKTGMQGVEINTLPNYPPATPIYDLNELQAIVEVKNKGNHNLEPQDCFIVVTGFDPNIIRGGFTSARSCAENVNVLEGKSVYNLEGGVNQIEFRSPNVELDPSVFDYNPTLNFQACYNYHTTASPEVCVDPLFYQIASEQIACNWRQGVNVGGGQGAPVGVSYVRAEMVGGRAIFDINVQNFGIGRVLSPFTDLQTCELNLQFTDFDRVAYAVEMGGVPGDCKPRDGFVRLYNNQGKITCSFDIFGSSAYVTPLLIDMDYNYVQSFKKNVKIIRTPQ